MAKPADDADENPPKAKRAKKRKGSPVAVRARKRRARKVVARSNPGGGGGGWGPTFAIVDDLKSLGGGLAAYGGTRLVQRLATKVAAKRKPTWARHIHALSGVATFAAAVMVGRRIKSLDGYHEAIVIGSGVAAAQGLVACYVPRFAWLMSGVPDQASLPAGPQATGEPDDDETDDYLETQVRQVEMANPRGRRPVQVLKDATPADLGLEEALVAAMGEDGIEDLYGGVFSDPTLLSTN